MVDNIKDIEKKAKDSYDNLVNKLDIKFILTELNGLKFYDLKLKDLKKGVIYLIDDLYNLQEYNFIYNIINANLRIDYKYTN